MLSEEIRVLEVAFPIWYTFITCTLKNNCLCRSIDLIAKVVPHRAFGHSEIVSLALIASDCEIVYNDSSKRRVSIAKSGRLA